jgi:hypothetical protein
MIIGLCILGWLLCGYVACMGAKRADATGSAPYGLLMLVGPLGLVIAIAFWISTTDRWIL